MDSHELMRSQAEPMKKLQLTVVAHVADEARKRAHLERRTLSGMVTVALERYMAEVPLHVGTHPDPDALGTTSD